MQKILFIYEGRNKIQNSIVSSTKQYIKDNLKKYYSIESLNIEKTNLKKYIINNSNYNIVYIFESEKSDDLRDIITNVNSNINLVVTNVRDSKVVDNSGEYINVKYNKIGIDLEEKVRFESGYTLKFKYSPYSKTSQKQRFTNYDFDKLDDYEKNFWYDYEEDCLIARFELISSEVKKMKELIELRNNEIDKIEKRIQEMLLEV